MRSVGTALCWLVATVALAVAVPATWAQRSVVDGDGFAALARSAATDRAVQDAMASELTSQALTIARDRGLAPRETVVQGVITPYTRSPAFPDQFSGVTRIAHRWLFTARVRQQGDRFVVDVAPMLSDTSIPALLNALGTSVPSSVPVPVDTADVLRPGQLQPLARWGPWVSIGAGVVTAVAALLTVAVARRRGKAVAALGVSALLVGGGGWAALEVLRGRIDTALNHANGNVRTVAEAMVNKAEGGLHQWLNLTLAAGGALVVFGIILAMLGALRRKPPRQYATETRTSAPL